MKKIIVFFFSISVFAQDYGNNAEALEICTTLQSNSFSSDLDADNALDRILSVVGLSKNFVLSPCSNINNAVAVSYKGVRYILYDPEFMSILSSNTSNWTNLFILAHEVGHHVNGHSLDLVLYAGDIVDAPELEKKRKQELEADEFAGFVLAKLGASLAQTTSSVSMLSNEDDKYSTHPKRDRRIAAIIKGYKNYKREIRVVSSQKDYNPPVEIISGDWKTKTSSRAQTRKVWDTENSDNWSKMSPIDKKKWMMRVPLNEKKVTATGISYDGADRVELIITFSKWDNEYGLSPDMLLINDFDIDYLNTLKEKKGIDIEINIRLGKELIPKASWDKPSEMDDILFDKLGFYPKQVYTHFEYLIDENIQGELYGGFKSWGITYSQTTLSDLDKPFSFEDYEYEFKDKSYSYNEVYIAFTKSNTSNFEEYLKLAEGEGLKIKTPKPYIFSPEFFVITNKNDCDGKNKTKDILKFINGVKQGKKLFIKFKSENLLGCEDNTYDYVPGLITQKTFVFDLKGSSKALTFKP